MNHAHLQTDRQTVHARAGDDCPECGDPTVIVACARPECDGASVLCSGCPNTMERYVWDDGLCASCGAARV